MVKGTEFRETMTEETEIKSLEYISDIYMYKKSDHILSSLMPPLDQDHQFKFCPLLSSTWTSIFLASAR